MDSQLIQTLLVSAFPLLFAITLHEAAHGYVAKLYGDNTALWAGRITLNPIKHIDPVGTVLLPLAILATSSLMGVGGFLFGWAKPVPVNFGNLKNPKRDIRYVAFAGPAANFAMALMWGLAFKLMIEQGIDERFFLDMAKAGIFINLWLAAINLLPILPLDGGRILFSLLPTRLSYQFSKTERYGMMILIALMFLNVLPWLTQPVVNVSVHILKTLLNF